VAFAAHEAACHRECEIEERLGVGRAERSAEYRLARRTSSRAGSAETAAAVDLVNVKPTTLAGVTALLALAADYVAAGGLWPDYLFDDEAHPFNPALENEPGRDWSFYLHRMLSSALESMMAA